MTNDVPRVLRLTFEFHIPRGLRTNIRNDRRESAVASLISSVEALAHRLFPWADRMTVRQEWSYAWVDRTETITLPENDLNTRKP
ncbi:hypothetical protein EV284_6463 [Streptomyces sp. BK022]|uniref:hypothetical protein n=1 Tax=Streptomyces sp. BK022 TaxID=2512123 RepID=UPI00102A4A1E|nr:hypothetical protein [Streptomyces sp. BK022]RZU28297.1 hypothetical protein EV284_6463 [Streptomyces sp. BK022]